MQVRYNVNLKDYTSFGIGNKATMVYYPEELQDVFLLKNIFKCVILGGATNVLINDVRKINRVIIMNKFLNSIFINNLIC